MENQEKRKGTEPHVHLFGEEINSKHKNDDRCTCEDWNHNSRHGYGCRCHHHSHGGGMIFGLAVLLVGVLLLLNNTQVVPGEIWIYILPFWPVLLILVGLKMILGRNVVSHFIVSLLTLAAFCLVILYALVMVNSPLVGLWHIPAWLINFISQFK
jgi:hypothetical protein